MGLRILTISLRALLFGTFLGCSREPEGEGPKFGTKPQSGGVPVYHLAVYPSLSPAKLMLAYQPLIDYLDGRLQGARLTLEASLGLRQVRGKVARMHIVARAMEEAPRDLVHREENRNERAG
jgi:phosphonate transport system substrate-binding protein